ncbi:MAG: hypothetical protein MUF54_14580, partial [Polyangiaceae bacterium]|nr:hypothetical protein [Polyangiaceae bacterium]
MSVRRIALAQGGMRRMALLAACSVLSCAETTTFDLQDTENRRLALSCKNGACRVTSAPEAHPPVPKPEGTEPAFVIHRAS